MSRFRPELVVSSPSKRVSFQNTIAYKASGGSTSPPSTDNISIANTVVTTAPVVNPPPPTLTTSTVPPPTATTTANNSYLTNEPFKPQNEYKPETYLPPSTQQETYNKPQQEQPVYKPAAPAESYQKPETPSEDTLRRSEPRQYPQSYQNQQRPASGSSYPSNYQNSPNYQQNYPQNYQPPKPQPPPQQPSSANLNPPRSNAYPTSTTPVMQRQPSTTNTVQRPYQPPPPTQAKPPAPQKPPPQQAPRPTSYTPSSQSYQTSPAPRTIPQTSQSYTPSRPATQRPPTTSSASLYSSNTSNYSSNPPRTSTLNYPAERWSSEQSRPVVNRNYSSTFALDDDLKPTYQEPISESIEEDKAGLQAKFKSMVRQKIQATESATPQALPVRPVLPAAATPLSSEVTNRMLTRTNSSAKIISKIDESFEEMSKIAESPKKETSPPRGDDDDDDDDDEEDMFSQDSRKMETSVLKNIKFFEQNDKAKIPLIPKSPSIEKKEKPVRPSHIEIVTNRESDDEEESGVDESPVKHPNLRSISQTPRKVARISSAGGGNYSSRQWVTPRSSYPGTPTRVTSAPSSRSTPHTPKRSTKPRFNPDEELLDFFRSPVKKTRFYTGDHSTGNSAGKENRPTTNGVAASPKKPASKLPSKTKAPTSPSKTPLKSPSTVKSLPKTPESPTAPSTPLIKKIPMNKIQVGAAPSPNLKVVKSKIGSLANTTHKPGGGHVKIESHKVNFIAQPRIAAKNDAYVPGGGEKKIPQMKLQWNAKPKVGSLENSGYRPGGGEKKIESVKLDFKEKAKPKVGSKENVKHVPGGGAVKSSFSQSEGKPSDIESQKLEFKAQSKIGSLDNVKHKPGGGDVKIYDDKTYLKQMSSAAGSSGNQSNDPNCDLSVVTEVKGKAADDSEATDISIKKTTTIAATKPSVSKTTEVTVVTRSPSKERKVTKSPSTHEVKLTYSTVTSPTKQQRPPAEPKPIQVVKVAAVEHAPVFNPSISDKEASQEARPPLPSTLSSASDKKETEVKKPPEEVKEKPAVVIPVVKEAPITKLLQNEAAAHEKVGEIWKEVQNTNFAKPPPPPLLQQQQQQQQQQPPPPPPQQKIPYQPQNPLPMQPRPPGPPPQQRPPPPPQQYPPNRPSMPQHPGGQFRPMNPPPSPQPRFPPVQQTEPPRPSSNTTNVPPKILNPDQRPPLPVQQPAPEHYNYQVPKNGAPPK